MKGLFIKMAKDVIEFCLPDNGIHPVKAPAVATMSDVALAAGNTKASMRKTSENNTGYFESSRSKAANTRTELGVDGVTVYTRTANQCWKHSTRKRKQWEV